MRHSIWQRRGLSARVVQILLVTWAPAAYAHSLLPLVTEEVETLPAGQAEVTIGAAYFKDLRFPPFTPAGTLDSQDLLAAPQLGFRIAAGGWAEIQAGFELLYLDERTVAGQTNQQFGAGDMRLFTKVRIRHEREYFPGVGLRFGAKLPNANRGNRLGTDDTDFGADVLASKSLGPVSVHANMGLLLLGNSGATLGSKFHAGGQDDLFNVSIGAVSIPLGQVVPEAVQMHLLGELTAQAGSRYDNNRAAARLGVQLRRGPGSLYVGASVGLRTASEDIGASAGFIYGFEPAALLGLD